MASDDQAVTQCGGWQLRIVLYQSNPIFIQNCPHYELLHLNVNTFIYINRLITLVAAWGCKKPSKTSGRKKLQYDGSYFLDTRDVASLLKK